jgi:hypothetical protein
MNTNRIEPGTRAILFKIKRYFRKRHRRLSTSHYKKLTTKGYPIMTTPHGIIPLMDSQI